MLQRQRTLSKSSARSTVRTNTRFWRAAGIDDSPVDSTAVNESVKPLCLALPPRAAVALCLASAAAIDAELETVAPDLMAAIEASPNHYRFNRSLHRNGHLDEIESLVQK